MTDTEKIQTIATLLGDGGEAPTDEVISLYLTLSKNEILAWKYHLVGGVPSDVTDIPSLLESTQIYAVVAGYTHAGAEGQKVHNENGISRTFIYSDMLDYIHDHVIPYARVGAVSTS